MRKLGPCVALHLGLTQIKMWEKRRNQKHFNFFGGKIEYLLKCLTLQKLQCRGNKLVSLFLLSIDIGGGG